VLNPLGEVQDIVILRTSGNPSLDTLVQAIRNASPFTLPKDDEIRKNLLKFTWDVVI
jgi:outer membrane biosynthesis protein TonB